MKSFLEVEKNRVAYHSNPNKNSVHRSSLLVPKFDWCSTNITFLNHFLLKRNYKEVSLKITAIDVSGNLFDTLLIFIDEPKVYSFDLDDLFDSSNQINEYLIEFFSEKNLFIPFPAVMVNHIGNDFINVVHSYNRVLNDIFENDIINKKHVSEASVDIQLDDKHDTFFNFASGPFNFEGEIAVEALTKSGCVCNHFPIKSERLTNKNYFLSEIFPKVQSTSLNGATIKILQPKDEKTVMSLIELIKKMDELLSSA